MSGGPDEGPAGSHSNGARAEGPLAVEVGVVVVVEVGVVVVVEVEVGVVVGVVVVVVVGVHAMSTTTVINLYGGPGTGKSTCAAYLFSRLKQAGLNAELVREYVKQWAWADRRPVQLDQFYFFGHQSQRESSLFGKVDWLVTDCPVALTGYYAYAFGTPRQALCFEQMVRTYYSMCEEQGVRHEHVWLLRDKPYNPAGRYQTEAEARAIDVEMVDYLSHLGIGPTTADASPAGVDGLLPSLGVQL